MTSVKIAASLPDDVFAGLEAAAHEEQRSRSAVVTSALIRYLRERESRRMTEQLNEAYGADTDSERAERDAWLGAGRRTVAKRLADDEW